jgi:hypothetical protein
VALAALAAGSDVLIRSAGADSTRAPIGAPPPFFYVEAKDLGMALARLGRKKRRENSEARIALPPHPEVRAQRASKDAGPGTSACILRGSRWRASTSG